MVSNDDFDGKATHLNCFYLHINFEQKYPKPAIVRVQNIINPSLGYYRIQNYNTRGLSMPFYPNLILISSKFSSYENEGRILSG